MLTQFRNFWHKSSWGLIFTKKRENFS